MSQKKNKNNLLSLNIFFYFPSFFISLYFFFPKHFPLNFLTTKHSLLKNSYFIIVDNNENSL